MLAGGLGERIVGPRLESRQNTNFDRKTLPAAVVRIKTLEVLDGGGNYQKTHAQREPGVSGGTNG